MSRSDSATTSGGSARIELGSANALLEIAVIGSDFRPVASGVGSLRTQVDPGIYQVVTRAGPAVARQLITLAPGETYRADHLGVQYPSSAPVAGTTTTHEYHQDLAREATQRAQAAGASSWLAVMVRDVRGRDGPPLDISVLARVEILDRNMRPVPNLGSAWDLRAPDAAAAWSAHLPPGPYLLRVRSGDDEPIDQALWVASGWQTVVFLTADEQGPMAASVSVHMVDVNLPWGAWEEGTAEAAELASWALRTGREVVPADLLDLLLNRKFRNPMFGVIGAHAMLLQPSFDAGYLQTVLRNLDSLIPGHPDLAALWWIAEERRAQQEGRGPALPAGVADMDWPPMLLPSYQALLRMDAHDPGALRDGSVAERIAGNLVVHGIWTAWRPVPPDLEPTAGAPPREAWADGLRAPRAPRERPGAATGAMLADLAPSVASLAVQRLPDPATARIARYLASVAELEGEGAATARFAETTSADLALATRLPTATVERSVRELHDVAMADGPPGREEHRRGDDGDPPVDPGRRDGGGGGGGGGGAGFRLWIALLGALGLLLLVGLGVAIGIGIFDDRDDPTPTPSASPSATASATAVASGTASATPSPTATPTPTPVPVPDALIDPELLDYGVVLMDDRRVGTVSVASTGTAPITILAAAVSEGGEDYALVGEDCVGSRLEPQQTCSIDVLFSPVASGVRRGILDIEVEELGVRRVDLSGIGEARDVITIKPDPAFPGSDWTPVTLAISEGGPVRLADVRLGGTNPDAFDLDPAGCLGQPELAAGATCDVLLRLRPETDQFQSYVAALVVDTAGGASYTGVLRWDYVD